MYDYIIVGSGPAGSCMAYRLSEDPKVKVLLLEVGKPDRHPYFHMPVAFAKLTKAVGNWGYQTVPQKHLNGYVMNFPQGKILGGGSTINAMVYTRGNRRDYDRWAQMGCVGWSYQEILPYFKKWENNEVFDNEYHATGGPVSISNQISTHPMSKVFLRAAQQTGIPYNHDVTGAKQEGVGIYQVFQKNAKRCGATTAYLKPTLQRPNFHLKTGVLTTRIILEGNKAVGVEYLKEGSKQTVRAEREVIVAAGAIGSPKLLMLSGIGDADELQQTGVDVKHHLPGVGKNFHDHFDIYTVYECSGPYSYDKHTQPHKTLWAGIQYVLFKNGPVTSNLAEAGGFWYTDGQEKDESPDVQFHFLPGSGLEYGVGEVNSYGVTLNSAVMCPQSRGTIRLKTSDPMVHPLINPNYLDHPEDRKRSLQGFRMAREIMNQEAFKPFITKEALPGKHVQSDEDILAYASKYAKSDYHPVGACKMGVDAMAVVDPQLRVHGIENLRVADSSIMPQVISSNTNGVSYMIGEKAADMILGPEA